MKTILEVKKLSFRYPNSDSFIFENLNFNIKDNEFISILGRSGCGKTTLLRILAGLEKSNVSSLIKKNIGISYMPQKDSLFPWRNIISNLVLPLEIKGIDKKKSLKIAEELLQKLHLESWKFKYPYELSGGMRQRISFLRTLISDEKLILLDEPFSALDYITKLELRVWLKDIFKTLNKSFIFITHDIDEALELSERILVFSNLNNNALSEFVLEKNMCLERREQMKQNILNLIRRKNEN